MHNYTICTAHIVYRKQLTKRVNLYDHIKYFCKQSMAGSKENLHWLPRNNLNSFHSEEIAFKDTVLNINNVSVLKQESVFYSLRNFTYIYKIYTLGMVLKQTDFFLSPRSIFLQSKT